MRDVGGQYPARLVETVRIQNFIHVLDLGCWKRPPQYDGINKMLSIVSKKLSHTMVTTTISSTPCLGGSVFEPAAAPASNAHCVMPKEPMKIGIGAHSIMQSSNSDSKMSSGPNSPQPQPALSIEAAIEEVLGPNV